MIADVGGPRTVHFCTFLDRCPRCLQKSADRGPRSCTHSGIVGCAHCGRPQTADRKAVDHLFTLDCGICIMNLNRQRGYAGPLRAALAEAYPEIARNPRKKFLVLEDNDPAGYKCRKAMVAKAEAGIKTTDLPPRSPDLNVLDYSLWHAINVEMRKQEARFHKGKVETKAAFIERLKDTALALPGPVVKKAVRDMERRLLLIKKAKGGLIEE